MSEREETKTLVCGACGGPVKMGDRMCSYCSSTFAPKEATLTKTEVNLLKQSQVQELEEYLGGGQIEGSRIYAFFSLLMSAHDDNALSLILMPMVAPTNPTWHVSHIANTNNRNTRDFDLAQYFISHNMAKEILRKLPRTVTITSR